MALRALSAAETGGCLLQEGHSVYVSLFAVEPGAAAQEVHSDAPDKAKGSYTTVVVPLTGHRGQGTTEFACGGGFAVPRGDGAYAFDGRVAHRGGANLSRGWRCALCVVVCKGDDPNRLGGGSTSWAGHF
jgi:ectoine hydroxylase-related dioxygenase (phytanoyl-CoA dioxygenase family)